jgi:hypothetical protein
MPKFIVRPYFGHDCNSDSGFNDGNYLPAIEVDADDESAAITAAMAMFMKDQTAPEGLEIDGGFGDGTLYWETAHRYVTEDGTEYDDVADIPLGDADTAIEPENGNMARDFETFYLYRFIDFNDVTEGSTK